MISPSGNPAGLKNPSSAEHSEQPAQQGAQWQPIETLTVLKAQKAAKNLFWLDWAPGCGPGDGAEMHPDDLVFCGKYQGWSSVFTATHWMPVPEPPQ